jgi:hypothetical protein
LALFLDNDYDYLSWPARGNTLFISSTACCWETGVTALPRAGSNIGLRQTVARLGGFR